MWKKGNLEVAKGHFGESNGLWEEEVSINVLLKRKVMWKVQIHVWWKCEP